MHMDNLSVSQQVNIIIATFKLFFTDSAAVHNVCHSAISVKIFIWLIELLEI